MFISLSRKIGIETASFDSIIAKNGELIFLEANPVGQFDFLNKTGNFYLDKKIANYIYEKTI